jgi:hypothetical protein
MFIGDVTPLQFFGPQILFKSMATAIARLYTPQGFVVGADGRRRQEDKGVFTVASDTQQKVFPLESGDMNIAYCMAGAIVITPEDRDDLIVFDLMGESKKANETLATQRFDNLQQYAQGFAELIHEKLALIQRVRNVKLPERKRSEGQPDFVICHVFFDGYFRDRPQRAFARFTHENQRLLQPFVSAEDLYTGHVLGYGSQVMHNLVFNTDDPRFQKYRLPYRSPEKIELRDAVEMINNFIEACSSPEAAEVDPERCAAIGGHISIGTVTLSKGFRWVKDHAPLAD